MYADRPRFGAFGSFFTFGLVSFFATFSFFSLATLAISRGRLVSFPSFRTATEASPTANLELAAPGRLHARSPAAASHSSL